MLLETGLSKYTTEGAPGSGSLASVQVNVVSHRFGESEKPCKSCMLRMVYDVKEDVPSGYSVNRHCKLL